MDIDLTSPVTLLVFVVFGLGGQLWLHWLTRQIDIGDDDPQRAHLRALRLLKAGIHIVIIFLFVLFVGYLIIFGIVTVVVGNYVLAVCVACMCLGLILVTTRISGLERPGEIVFGAGVLLLMLLQITGILTGVGAALIICACIFLLSFHKRTSNSLPLSLFAIFITGFVGFIVYGVGQIASRHTILGVITVIVALMGTLMFSSFWLRARQLMRGVQGLEQKKEEVEVGLGKLNDRITSLVHALSSDACQTMDTDHKARAFEEAEAVSSRLVKRMEAITSIHDAVRPFMQDPYTAFLSLPHCSERLSVLNKEIDSFLLQIKVDTELLDARYEALVGKS